MTFVFVFLKTPKDLKIEKIPKLYDTQSFSQSSLVNGSLGINWGAFKEFITSRGEVCLTNSLKFFLIATVLRGTQHKQLQQKLHLFG